MSTSHTVEKATQTTVTADKSTQTDPEYPDWDKLRETPAFKKSQKRRDKKYRNCVFYPDEYDIEILKQTIPDFEHYDVETGSWLF